MVAGGKGVVGRWESLCIDLEHTCEVLCTPMSILSGNELDDADPDDGESGEASEAKAEGKPGGQKGKAKAKAKGNAKCKRTLEPEGVTTPQKKARVARTPKTGEKKTASVRSGGNSDQLLLGCSKCRFSKRGCAKCKALVRVGRARDQV